ASASFISSLPSAGPLLDASPYAAAARANCPFCMYPSPCFTRLSRDGFAALQPEMTTSRRTRRQEDLRNVMACTSSHDQAESSMRDDGAYNRRLRRRNPAEASHP